MIWDVFFIEFRINMFIFDDLWGIIEDFIYFWGNMFIGFGLGFFNSFYFF